MKESAPKLVARIWNRSRGPECAAGREFVPAAARAPHALHVSCTEHVPRPSNSVNAALATEATDTASAARAASVMRTALAARARYVMCAACVLAAMSLAQPAVAQDRPIRLRLNTSTTRDANVFRVPNSEPDPQLLTRGIPGKSDFITATTVGLLIDKAYAQQRFKLDASQTANRHANFKFLDMDAFQYNAVWQWSLTPRISGSLSVSHAESLIPFDDLTSSPGSATATQGNVRTTDTRSFNLDSWIAGGWHVLAGAVNTESKNSEVFLAQPGSSSVAGNVGLKYIATSGNSITATSRTTRGTNASGQAIDPANPIGDKFSVQELELMATWRLSGRSTLNGRLTRHDRRTENLSGRDFSATNGELSYLWAVDSRQQLNFSASRNVMPWTADSQASYKVDDRLSLTDSVRISDKVTASLAAYRVVSDYLSPIAPLTGPPRRDTMRGGTFSVNWSPSVRNLVLTGSVQRDLRSSNAAGQSFEDTLAMLNASLIF